MPPVNPVPPKAKKAKPAKVRVTVPDAGEETRTQRPTPPTVKVRMYAHPGSNTAQNTFRTQRTEQTKAREQRAETKRAVAKIHVTPVASPDATDSLRSPAQKQHDAAAAAESVKSSRVKALRDQNHASGTNAVKAWVKSNIAAQVQAKTTDSHGHHGSGPFAVLAANLPVGAFSVKEMKNAAKDAAELAVTTPSSVAKLASDIRYHPKKVPGELVKPYVDFAHAPLKTAEDKPISTALMLQPLGRVPGAAAGRIARVAGKQTLERAPATLPGTALKVARVRSRDYLVNRHQAAEDAKVTAPTVTAKQVQARVDAHFDHAKHESHRIVGEHVQAAKQATKGQPKPVQQAAVDAAREHGRQVADELAQERFAREFGANERLSHGVVAREATHAARRQAVKVTDAARAAVKQADAVHEAALTAAKVARAKVKSSPKLAALEAHRDIAVKGVVAAQKQGATARATLAKAQGRAEVLTRNVGKPAPGQKYSAGGHGVTLAQAEVDAAAQAVRDARARVKDFDQQIGVERQRISGVPPAQAKALGDAIHARGQARVVLAQARADAHVAAHAHIAAKKAMTNSTLVSPAETGRLFAHKADAATVVKKLNQSGAEMQTGFRAPFHYETLADGKVKLRRNSDAAAQPVKFVLRQVGQDRWAAVPNVAANRLLKHQVVGSSPAPLAKAMRVSRTAFTQATLPFSLKWLAGQGVEAPIRAAVAGAGPFDWLRAGKVVKKMNAQKAGSGDEWAMRQTGGHFDLGGPARDFANGKSLADEFKDTPAAQAAAAVTHAGQAPGIRHVRQGFKLYSRAVLGSINHVIESNTRRAMSGQAIKNLGFQDDHIIGLTDKAIEDAANHLHGTHNQVAASKAVNDMYGKYAGFSPEMRSLIMHWTPFAPWFLNSVKFLTKTLPIDHPVKAALLADASNAEEEWRKAHGLSFRGPHVPWYLMGSYPTKDGKFLRVAHYTPWGIGADPTGAAGSLALPQVLGPVFNTAGVDWKGQRLTRGGPHGPEFNTGENLLRAGMTAAEEQIPGLSQAGKISGLTPRYIDKDSPENIKSPGEVLKSYLPWTPASGGAASSSGAPSSSSTSTRVKIPGVGSGRVKLPGGATGRIKIP